MQIYTHIHKWARDLCLHGNGAHAARRIHSEGCYGGSGVSWHGHLACTVPIGLKIWHRKQDSRMEKKRRGSSDVAHDQVYTVIWLAVLRDPGAVKADLGEYFFSVINLQPFIELQIHYSLSSKQAVWVLLAASVVHGKFNEMCILGNDQDWKSLRLLCKLTETGTALQELRYLPPWHDLTRLDG